MAVTRSQKKPLQSKPLVSDKHKVSKAKVIPESRISDARPSIIPNPAGLSFDLQPASFGLIQERISSSLYALCIQVILWNQTHGLKARPVLFQILALYPDPLALSLASLPSLVALLQPIGLQNIRAARIIALAKAWLAAPPCAERRYRKLHYPARGSGADVKPAEVLAIDDEREGWEIAHLPGMGAYALDSYRIFYRDRLRGIEDGPDKEPEWKRVVPEDKDLRAYLVWKWAQSGWHWDMKSGKRTRISLEEVGPDVAGSELGADSY